VPARFSENTDQGLDKTISGFLADEASFEIESLGFDDPVPLMPGGSPYGHQHYPNLLTDISLSARGGFYVSLQANAAVSGYLDDLDNYPTGGPHLFLQNYGSSAFTVRDALGTSVGTVAVNGQAWFFVREDGSGNRTPVLF